jgi:hypothetical protein
MEQLQANINANLKLHGLEIQILTINSHDTSADVRIFGEVDGVRGFYEDNFSPMLLQNLASKDCPIDLILCIKHNAESVIRRSQK